MTAPRDPIEAPATEAGRSDHETAWDSDNRIAETAIANHQWLAAGCCGCAGIARIEQQARDEGRREAVRLLDRLVDYWGDDPCRLDHHGYCQAHMLEDTTEDYCTVKVAREWLARHGRSSDPYGTDAGALANILDECTGGPWKPDDGTSLWFYNEAGDQICLTPDDVLLLLHAALGGRSSDPYRQPCPHRIPGDSPCRACAGRSSDPTEAES